MDLNDAVLTDIDQSVLCWLATVDENHLPNVTPKEIFAAYGKDHMVIADIASAKSVSNIRSNPNVCISFVDVFRQRGFKITGKAQVIGQDDEGFSTYGADVLTMAGPDFPIRNLILVEVSKIARIWAPSYRLFPDRTEEERMTDAYKTYGVAPI